MRAHLLCIPCTLRAAYNIAKKSTENEEVQRNALIEVLKWLYEEAKNLMSSPPAALHTHAFRIIKRITGNNDPFMHIKRVSNNLAMKMIPILEREIDGKTPREAIRIAALGAVCGNSIDFEIEGYSVSIDDLERMLLNCLRSSPAIDETDKMIEVFSRSKKILYLLDNAGEIVFDKFFIGMIIKNYPVEVMAAVKSGPILNDATIEDALEIGLHDVAEVITTGSDSIGLNPEEVSEDFRRRLVEANVIVAKGQGYYESLTELETILNKPIIYMLRAKCSVVAASLNVPQGSNVVKFVR